VTDPLEALESWVTEKRGRGFWHPEAGHGVIGVTHDDLDELEPIIQQLKEEKQTFLDNHDALVADIVDERNATVSALRFSEREWRDKAQDKIAEVEAWEKAELTTILDARAENERLEAEVEKQKSMQEQAWDEVESLRAEQQKDYAGMREFQLRFIGADQERRELRAERERYREALEVADRELGFVYEELQWATTLAAHDVVRHALQASSPKEDEYVDPGPDPQHVDREWLEGISKTRSREVAKDSDTPHITDQTKQPRTSGTGQNHEVDLVAKDSDTPDWSPRNYETEPR